MGCYDTVVFIDKQAEERYLQFKAGECLLRDYSVGDSVDDIADGIYFDYEDCFVVYDKKIVAAFSKNDNPLLNKWGGAIPFFDITSENPINKFLNS